MIILKLGYSATVMALAFALFRVFVPCESVSLGQGQAVTETLNVLTTQSTRPGNYNLTVTGNSTPQDPLIPPMTHTVVVSLVVTPVSPTD